MTTGHDHIARTERGLSYDKFVRTLLCEIEHPSTKELAEDLQRTNEMLRTLAGRGQRSKELTPGDVQTAQVLQDLSIMYANDEYIGTRTMPLVGTAPGVLSVEYWAYDKENKFSAPSDIVGTRGKVNEVSEDVTKTSTSLQRRALAEFVDAWTQSAMDNPVQQMVSPMLNVLDALAFNQELRIAAIVGATASFGSNTSAIAAADRWDSTTGGDPLGDIQPALAAMWIGNGPGKNIGVTSLSVYNCLVKHPTILDSFKYTQGGRVTREQLAAYFELDDLLVGKARKNTANQAAASGTYSRVWPDRFSIVRVAAVPGTRNASFGVTLADPIQQSQWYVEGDGGRGGYMVQASFADKSVVLAADCGYCLDTPIG
jgi:hypothetical protein